jgi:transcriptional regulator with XRE-family HTH domain
MQFLQFPFDMNGIYCNYDTCMNENEPVRKMLVALREKADLTQAQLAEKLSFTPSRLSRLEAGLTELNVEEAQQIAAQIPSDEAKGYAQYLGQQWKLTERPSFKHVSREHLWKAEQGLQRLNEDSGVPGGTGTDGRPASLDGASCGTDWAA